MPPPLIVPQHAVATSDGSGHAVFKFADVPLGEVWSGTVQIIGAPAGMVGIVQGGGETYGQMNGPGTFGPYTTGHSQPLTISATGLVAATQYEAVWHADSTGSVNAAVPQVISPMTPGSFVIPNPLPVSGTVTALQGSPPWEVDFAPGSVVGTDPTLAPVTGQQTSNTSQVQLSSSVSTVPPNGLLITALPTNAAPGVYFGPTGVTTSTGDLLQPGATKPLTCPPNAVYIIGANNTDRVTWEIL